MQPVYRLSMILTLMTAVQAPQASAELLDGQARCGTVDIIENIKVDRWQGRELPSMQKEASALECWDNLRPTYIDELTYTDEEYGFVIHYTLSTEDDTTVTEAQVQQTAEVMRDVIDFEMNTLGYIRPPDDEVDAEYYCDEGNGGNGGNGYYDVYFVDEDGVYGYAQPTVTIDAFEATSFLALSTWILDVPGALEVTVAHEFFHAVQFSYDVYESSAWMETSATWMEEVAYDDINDYYYYLEDAYEYPEASLDTFDSSGVIQYGNAIFPIYLTEQLNNDVVLDIWLACGAVEDENYLDAAKEILDSQYTGGFSAAILDFRSAMYDSSQFSEGENYPAPYIWEDAGLSNKSTIEETGAHIILLDPIDNDGVVSLCYEGESDDIQGRLYGKSSDGSLTILSELVGTQQFDIADFGTSVESIALVVANTSTTDRLDYSYDASGECDPPGCGCGPCSTSGDPTWSRWSIFLILGLFLRPRRYNS